jgi:Putative adhesin
VRWRTILAVAPGHADTLDSVSAAPSAPARRRPSAWATLVAVSAVLVIGSATALGVWWLASSQRQIATYAVRGAVSSITLDLGGASATVLGSGAGRAVEVRRTDDFAFGRRADARREVDGGALRLRSRCPQTVLASCSSSYRISVPNNIPVTVRTSSGDVRFSAYRGSARIDTQTGDIDVAGYCGFALQARAETGNVQAAASCAPERLELRSRTGDVHAVVPTGRYRIDADSDGGSRRVAGLTAAEDAPFQIQALSSAGDVEVKTR